MERTVESDQAAPTSRWPDDMIKGTYHIDVSLPLPKHLPRPWSSEEEVVIHVTIRHFQDPADESTGLKIAASVTLPSPHYQVPSISISHNAALVMTRHFGAFI